MPLVYFGTMARELAMRPNPDFPGISKQRQRAIKAVDELPVRHRDKERRHKPEVHEQKTGQVLRLTKREQQQSGHAGEQQESNKLPIQTRSVRCWRLQDPAGA